MSDDRSSPQPGEVIGHVVDLYVMDDDGTLRVAESMQQWADNQAKTRRVAHTELPDGRGVSTVFVGVDQGVYPGGPPLLFETAVKGNDGHWQPAERYPTRARALAGHAVWVAQFGRE